MRYHVIHSVISLSLLFVVGCGATQQRSGTEQLLLSDAVDRTVDQLDFATLSGRKVFLDTTYIQPVKGSMFVNADYIISALRHKLTVSGCLVQDSIGEADYVIEGRIGALGTDSLEVTYGLPASSALSTAANIVSGVPAMPSIPEISVGKRNAALSTSKIVLFAYHRESGTPIWQSGTSISKSDAKDTWVMGAGPLQRGSIYEGSTFAGIKLKAPSILQRKQGKRSPKQVTVADAHQFVHPAVLEQQLADAKAMEESAVKPASHEKEKPAKKPAK